MLTDQGPACKENEELFYEVYGVRRLVFTALANKARADTFETGPAVF